MVSNVCIHDFSKNRPVNGQQGQQNSSGRGCKALPSFSDAGLTVNRGDDVRVWKNITVWLLAQLVID